MARRGVSDAERARIAREMDRISRLSESAAQREAARLFRSLRNVSADQVASEMQRRLPAYSQAVADAISRGIASAGGMGAAAAARQIGALRPGWERAARFIEGRKYQRALPGQGSADTLSAQIWRQSSVYVERLRTSLATAMREGEGAIEIARRLRDVEGLRAWVEQPQLQQQLWDATRRMVGAATDDPRALAQWARLRARAERYIERLSATAGEYGMRAAHQHAADQLVKALAAGREDAVERARRWWLYDKQAYDQRRLAVTETARAYSESFKDEADVPWVIGFKWNVETGADRKRDICDVHANANRFGLGAGVYPFDRVPTLPAHPFCKCYLTEVMDERIPEDGERPPAPLERSNADAAWLRSQPASVQREILGQGRYDVFRRTGNATFPGGNGAARHRSPATRGPSYDEASAR